MGEKGAGGERSEQATGVERGEAERSMVVRPRL